MPNASEPLFMSAVSRGLETWAALRLGRILRVSAAELRRAPTDLRASSEGQFQLVSAQPHDSSMFASQLSHGEHRRDLYGFQ
jgi:hypothetical protein